MPIHQKVKVAKQSTDDGKYKIAAPVGDELWIVPGSIEVKTWRFQGMNIPRLAVQIVGFTGAYIPVELLDFTNDFRITDA